MRRILKLSEKFRFPLLNMFSLFHKHSKLNFLFCFSQSIIGISPAKTWSPSFSEEEVKLKTPLHFLSFSLSAQVSTEEKCYLLDSAYLKTVSPFLLFFCFTHRHGPNRLNLTLFFKSSFLLSSFFAIIYGPLVSQHWLLYYGGKTLVDWCNRLVRVVVMVLCVSKVF